MLNWHGNGKTSWCEACSALGGGTKEDHDSPRQHNLGSSDFNLRPTERAAMFGDVMSAISISRFRVIKYANN